MHGIETGTCGMKYVYVPAYAGLPSSLYQFRNASLRVLSFASVALTAFKYQVFRMAK